MMTVITCDQTCYCSLLSVVCVLQIDMRSLKKDPRVIEKFNLDAPNALDGLATPKPASQQNKPFSAFSSRWFGKLWPKDGDW